MNTSLPILLAEEQRVLGSLMEKSKTTPEYYPLTVNSLLSACNQKTSRKPIVTYDESTILLTLDSLRKKGLVSTATGGSSRVTKYKHNFAIVYPLVPSEVAILCMLLLRGPLTPGELNNNSGKMYDFESLDEVQDLLDGLARHDTPFVAQLPKKPGQKEARYIHLLGEIADFEEDTPSQNDLISTPNLEARLQQVEAELAQLRLEFDLLMKQLS